MIGQTLATYRLVEKLGEGGMGEVYRALDEMLDRDVALKMLRPELASRPSTVDRFRAEAITLAKLDHPGIARIHGCSRHEDRWFIVMEFVPGETLLARLARAGRLPWLDAVPIVCQLLDALEYAHRRGVIHRDMKPANVLMGEDGRVKVTDFGIARVLGTERATRTGHIVGTLEYMSPEQVRGEEVDGRADLYAVGILLYELLAGRVPFSGAADYEVMMQHLQAPVPPLRRVAPDVPPWFDEILRRALAKAPADRFASAAMFQVAIEAHAAAEPAMRIKATRLAAAALDAAVIGGAGALPRATDTQGTVPYALAPTRLAERIPVPAPTLLASAAASVAAAHASGYAPGHATGQPPAPNASGPLAPLLTAVRTTLGRVRGGGITWRQMTAAGALVVVLIASAIALGRYLTGDAVDVAHAGSSGAETPRAIAPRPDDAGRILDAPPPEPIGPASPPDLGTAPIGRLPGAPTPAPLRPAPPAAAPRTGAPPAADRGPAPAPDPEPGEPPATAATPAPREHAEAGIEFEEVALVTMSCGEAQEREVVLRFEPERLVLTDADSQDVVRTLTYRSLSEATYARSRNPIAKAERNRPTLVRGLAKSVSFFRRTPHWLTLEGAGAPVVLKVDGDDIERLLPLLEARSSVRVERVSEK